MYVVEKPTLRAPLSSPRFETIDDAMQWVVENESLGIWWTDPTPQQAAKRIAKIGNVYPPISHNYWIRWIQSFSSR